MNRVLKIIKNINPLSLILAISLFGILIYTFYGANFSFNSDYASANILAKEQIRTGQLIPSTWYYATDITLIFINLPMIIFSLFLNNQLLIRSFGVLTFIIISFFSLKLFCKSIATREFFLIESILLFTGFSAIYNDYVFGQSAYINYLFIFFLILGLFFKSFDDNLNLTNKKYLLSFIIIFYLFTVTSYVTIQIYVIPLIGSLLLNTIYNNHKNDNVLKEKEIKNCIIIIGSIALSTVICMIIYNVLIYSNANISYSFSQKFNDDIIGYFQKFIKILFIDLFGIQTGIELFTFQGILNIVKLFFNILLAFVFPILLISKIKQLEKKIRIFLIFSWLHILEIYFILIFCNLLIDGESARYYLSSLILQYSMSGYYIYKFLYKDNKLCRILIIVILTILSIIFTIPKVETLFIYEEKMEQKYNIIECLNENELNYGYATFWNAQKNTVLSDFNIQINSIKIKNGLLVPSYWLSSSIDYNAENYNGKTFLLLKANEYANVKDSLLMYGIPIEILYENDNVILVYNYNLAQNDFKGIDLNSAEKIIENVYDFSGKLLEKNEKVSVYSNQVDLKPYYFYQISFVADVIEYKDDFGLNIDLYSSNSYDNNEQETYVKLEPGKNEYTAYINSGNCNHLEQGTAYLRFMMYKSSVNVLIENVQIVEFIVAQ